MEWLHYVVPPVVGAIIGYATNYLALKMLFRPKKALYIGNWHVPFTPGIIPKRKNELAHAIGELVAARFFTDADIREFFLSDQMRQAVAEGIADGGMALFSGQTVGEIGEALAGPEEMEQIMLRAEKITYQQVRTTILHSDIFDRVESGAKYMIRRKLAGTALQHIVSEKQLDSISKTVSYEMQKYMYEHMEDLLLPIVAEKGEEICGRTLAENLGDFEITRDMVYEAGLRGYEKFVEESLDQVVHVFDIAKLTEKKITEMDAGEVENLCHLVIRREMQAVIYLGALLGAVIGLVNIFFI